MLYICVVIFALYMNNQVFFTTEEERANYERKVKLIDLVASGKATLLVGAGSSKRVGYPDWRGLLKRLEDLTVELGYGFKRDPEKREKSPLKYAQEIKTHICRNSNEDRYHILLEKLLEFMQINPRINEFHQTLVSLPFKRILTTNYDMVLEAALENVGQKPAHRNSLIIHEDFAGEVTKYIRNLNEQKTPQRIVHLHGRYDHPKGIILTSKDYEDAYGFVIYDEDPELENYQKTSNLNYFTANQGQKKNQLTLHQHLLRTILSTCRLVFIGFSMSDPYFDEMINTVSSDMREGGQSIHFAIMDTSSNDPTAKEAIDAKVRKRDYGVETVFYKICRDSDAPHQGLDKIINEIAKQCGVEISSTPESFGDPVSELEDVLHWLEQANESAERGIDDEN